MSRGGEGVVQKRSNVEGRGCAIRIKNFMNKVTGINKFSTILASKSSLIQRAGRVGRVCDGQVYRLIEKAYM